MKAMKPEQALEKKFQRVPILFHSHKNFKDHFEPRAVSFGPVHHRKPGLELAENIKLRLAEQFIIDSRKNKYSIYREVKKDIKYMRDCYEKEATKDYEDDDLAWMMFVDGCSMLSFIDYFINGDKFDRLNVKSDIAAFWLHDMFLLENQLPFRLLKLLMRATEQEQTFHKSIQDFIVFNNIMQGKRPTLPSDESNKPEQSLDDCPHLLDLLRSEFVSHRSSKHNNFKSQFPDSARDKQSCPATNETNLNADAVTIDIQVENVPHKRMKIDLRKILCRNTRRAGEDDKPATFRSVKTRKATGIRVHSRSSGVTEIELKSSSFYLGANSYLSPFIVDDGTASKFLNLAAYEMCPDFFNDFAVTSYVCFLDMLIDEAEDVKILRDAEVLYNVLGSDQEVAQLFNEISTDLVLHGDDKYADVKRKIQEHHGNKGKTWVAQFYHIYHFSSPWTMIAFVAAILGLGLSFVQAWSAMMPDDPCKKVCRSHSL